MIKKYQSIFKEKRIDRLLEDTFNIKIRDIKFLNFIEAVKWNGVFYHKETKRYSVNGTLLKESITYEFENKGGMVVFSTDINVVIDERGFFNIVKDFFKRKFNTLINRFKKHEKLYNVLKTFKEVEAYSVGNLFKGKHLDRETGKTYDERSMTVEIIGIPYEILIAIAEAIAGEFDQKEVLVKSYENGRILLVDRK